MMNILALVLVATSLAAAGVWSPPASGTTQKHEGSDEVIVKEGHRVIVVEYEKEQAGVGNTKVSISPPHEDEQPQRLEGEEDAKEHGGGGVKEVICDAFGKCKHVITSVVGGGKKTVSDMAEEVGDNVAQKGYELKEGAREAAGKADDLKQGAEKAVAGAKDEGADMVKEGAQSVAHKARKGTDKAKEAVHSAKQTVTSLGKNMTDQARSKVKQGVEVAEEAMDTVADKAKAGAEMVKEEGKQELREIYDLGKQLVQHIWSYLAWGRTLDSVMGLLHLIGFCMAYGMAVWVTFVSSNVMSRALPRQQFGVLQSKIYPVYFRAMAYSVGMSLLGHLLGQRRRLWSDKAEMFQGYNLGLALGMVMINLHYLEPRASKVMFERMKEEKEEGRGRDPYLVPESTRTTEPDVTVAGQQDKPVPNDKSQDRIFILSQKLKKLNSHSSLVNVVSLMSLTWHLVYLSQRVNACR
uniref:TMEM205-like domain-containing protein n=1 Tax=Kalanchoe fedtschenkoi TaxID=63787 RepID=A0A7N0VN18_KALFE